MRVNDYLSKRKAVLECEKAELITAQKKVNSEIEAIQKMLDSQENKIDIAYEIFSPKSNTSNWNKEEINRGKKKMEDLSQVHLKLDKRIQGIIQELDELNVVIEEVSTLQPKRNVSKSRDKSTKNTKNVDKSVDNM